MTDLDHFICDYKDAIRPFCLTAHYNYSIPAVCATLRSLH